MSFTFSTLISMIIINAVFVIALNQMIKTSAVNYFNIDLFLLASFAVLIRFLLPFEFPFTISVPVKWGLSYLYDFFVMLEFHVHGYTLNVFTIFTFGWCIGIIVCGIRLFVDYATIRKRYHLCEVGEDSNAHMILREIEASHPKSKAVFRVYTTNVLVSPFIFGVLHPTIILPESVDSDEELFYILSHETAHYYNRHTLYKFLCSLLDVIYFWNPLVKIFVKEVNRILEISVDSKVVAPLEMNSRLDYSLSLTNMARKISEDKTMPSFTTSFNSSKETEEKEQPKPAKSNSSLSQRVMMIVGSPDKIKTFKLNGFISALLLVAALTISLFFVFEPYRVREADAQSTFNSSNRDLFYIINDEGTYDLYFDGEYYKTESEISDPKLPVFESLPD